jgi:hypothetical protein
MRSLRQELDPVTKDDLTALIAMLDPDNLFHRRLNIRHMDLVWMRRRSDQSRVTPPNCHLNLVTVQSGMDHGEAHPGQVLINSPRSALVLLRHGVCVQDLLRRPWAQARHLHSAPFGAPETLALSDRKELALEKMRLELVAKLEKEYSELCAFASFEDIVDFCSVYDADRPSTALRIPFPRHPVMDRSLYTSSYGATSNLSTSKPPRDIAEESFQSSVRRILHREKLLKNSTDLRQDVARKMKTIALHDEQNRKLELRRRELDGMRSEKRVVLQGLSEVWNHRYSASERAASFRQLVRNVKVDRRCDEAATMKREMETSCLRLADHLRKSRSAASLSNQRPSSAQR